ncbi:MAG TPA: hypothetical protein VN706_04560 [Gemmatimonadaceae bacterium]|nr:hypothetical protein [Gemmatimonadaceae bacterium]
MRPRLVAVSVGVLALAGACATSTGSGTGSGSPTAFGPTAERRPVTTAERDSMAAQAIADREGPHVSVRAEVTQVSSSRRVRAAFNVEDDSYVMIGQVDAGGTVRIVFPTDPRDDGFVRGGKRYETADFFAGFTNQFRYRFDYSRYYAGSYHPDAYDGGVGYLFIVASWRPMHFDKVSSDGVWDSFDLADEQSLRDPKPAIYEMAALLAGENREAYTVQFARYFNTLNSAPYSSYSSFGYGAAQCGFGYGVSNALSTGWGASPFSSIALGMFGFEIANGLDFSYRGSNYLYDSVGDCYYRSPIYVGNPFTIASVPPAPPSRPRTMTATDTQRNPLEPGKPTGRQHGQVTAQDVGASGNAHFSPTYRQRGLITEEEGLTSPRRADPHAQPIDGSHTRPTIQQMVERHAQDASNAGNNEGWSRAFRGQASDAGNRGWSHAANQSGGSNSTNGSNSGYNPPRMRTENSGQGSTYTNPRGDTGFNRGSGDINRAPATRSEPTPRMEVPAARVAPPSPPPAPAPVARSEPASSSSSTGAGGAPVKPPAK